MNKQAIIYEVLYDAFGTVWINGLDGGLLGRFSRRGVDIHGSGHCIDCSSKFTNESDWQYFVSKMDELYLIKILKHLPKNFSPFK